MVGGRTGEPAMLLMAVRADTPSDRHELGEDDVAYGGDRVPTVCGRVDVNTPRDADGDDMCSSASLGSKGSEDCVDRQSTFTSSWREERGQSLLLAIFSPPRPCPSVTAAKLKVPRKSQT